MTRSVTGCIPTQSVGTISQSFMVPSKAKDFTEGTVGIISSFNHIYTVIDGMLDDYGSKVPLNKTPLFTDGVFGWQLGDKPKPRV